MHRPINGLIATAAMLLAACASYGPGDLRPGLREVEVTRQLGAPTARYALADGQSRLEFARGPYGRHTFMVDLDAEGRVKSWEQVLDPRHFDSISPGLSRDQLLRYIGTPSERFGIRLDGQVWSWRYHNNDCLWYQVQLDAAGVVTSAGYGTEPRCDARSDKSPT
ncbi:MAG: hypothetical protein JNJ42_03605 [Burkholderiaceae bacterium]|nr:hypothetical protein [Burkholderiaceae bacterium]